MPYRMSWWDGSHMTWFFPFMGSGWIVFWLILLVIAYLVYKDAEGRGMNGLLWAILVLLPGAGILFLIIYIAIRFTERPGERPLQRRRTPVEILDERYAIGELTRDQYLLMRDDLTESSRTGSEGHDDRT